MKKLTAILFAFTAIACNQQKVDTKVEGEKVMELSREWSKAAVAGDVEKVLSYWAEDAVMMSPGQPPLEGKNAIRKMVEESYKIPGFRISWEPKSTEVSGNGDMAYLLEDTQTSFTDSTGKLVTQTSNAVSIWRKQKDGSWKNAVDISTPDATQAK